MFDAAMSVRVSLDLVEINVKVRIAISAALYNPCSVLVAAHAGRRGLCVRRDRRGRWHGTTALFNYDVVRFMAKLEAVMSAG